MHCSEVYMRIPIDPAFVVSIREKLDAVKYLPFGEGKEEGGELRENRELGVLQPRGVNAGQAARVTIPRTRFVYHTHPSTCGPEAAGCSYDPPSETDMRNALRAAVCNDQRASVVFSQKGVYIVSVRRAFVAWLSAQRPAVQIESVNSYIRRAFKQMQDARVRPGAGPHYRKYLFNAAFVRNWLRFSNGMKLYLKGGKPALPSSLVSAILGLGEKEALKKERSFFSSELSSSPRVFDVTFFGPRASHVYVGLDD